MQPHPRKNSERFLDLHTHMKIAKRLEFRPRDVLRAAETLSRRGLAGLAITEHAHAIGFWDIYRHLGRNFSYRHGRFEVGDLCFYPGLELTLDEMVDITFIAPLEELRRLDEAFRHPLSAGYHPSAIELLNRLDELRLDAIRIAAHPVRDDKSVASVPEKILGAIVYALELNGRYTDSESVRRVGELSEHLGLPVVGGSDAHVWPQLGASCTLLRGVGDRYEDLRDAILSGHCRPIIDDDAARLVNAAERLKKRIKCRSPKLPGLPHIGPASAV